MNQRWNLPGVLLLGVIAGLTGCSKDTPSGPDGTSGAGVQDKQALQQMVVLSDSVNDFSTSDEATIDDNGIRPDEYDGFAKVSPDQVAISQVTSDSTYPVKWGRRIFWDEVIRTYTVTIAGDTAATVLVTKTLPGSFWVGWGTRSLDGIVVDTIIQKPFVETVQRYVLFRRVARHENPMRNWAPVAMTMVRGTGNGTNAFTIVSMEVSESIGGFDKTITNPLDTWFRLGWFYGSIPLLPVRDSVTVHVTLHSSDGEPELVYLRHSIDGSGGVRRRAMMPLVSVTGDSGNYTRIYERTFVTGLPPFVMMMRFNATADVFSRGTIYGLDAPFANEFWGAPYIVTRR